MAHPIDPKQGFMRTPARYPHDAFGVDTGGRVRPHSGFDSTPTVANAQARSVLGGRVVRADWTKYAGNYVVEDAPDGWLWLTLHLASRLVRAGATTAPGDAIGIVGNTGGGGALGSKATIGIHSHVSRCRDMAAVDRIVNGLVRARRKGETNQQWADAHGLSDPYPHIIASVDGKASTPTDPTKPLEEDFMAPIDEARFAALEEKVEATLSRVKAIRAEQEEEDGIAQALRADVAATRAILDALAPIVRAAGDDADLLARELVKPGERGYSAFQRVRSVLNTLEARQ